ncbi:armadillo-type protein [Lasiosphaeria hispida]|uniref:Armadillo-type protein n=1 Tax=Lasiosphaeria hispida TaxID=260671 RepID=A0AAJ0MD86_9PEZI|nr:armadillo-type protein [Lasiosphaeria hispida]
MPTMADLNSLPALPAGPRVPQHQRTKSSVLRSLMGHRKNNSDGSALPLAVLTSTTQTQVAIQGMSADAFPAHHYLGPNMSLQALSELQQNHQDPAQRSPDKSRDRDRNQATSPQKSTFTSISLKLGGKESGKLSKVKDPSSPTKSSSPTKPKKAKSVTNLGALLSRPKSIKNLRQLVSDEDTRSTKDKENRTPPRSIANDYLPPPPIYAQFASQNHGSQASQFSSGDPFGAERPGLPAADANGKQRPRSFQPYGTAMDNKPNPANSRDGYSKHGTDDGPRKRMTWAKGHGSKFAFPGLGSRTKSSTSIKSEPLIDHKDIDKHLEALLDRRNIPENQRYKMRNLNDTIKMEFIRQDWAETQAKLERPGTNESHVSTDGSAAGSDRDDSKKKHHRGISLTLGRGANKAPPSPTKKQKTDSSLGRHFRSKSTESVASDHPSSVGETSSNVGLGIFAKVKGQQRPADFVSYLRKVQQPELVEVGKLHKLRLLLRNETVTWTEDFIRQGGMEEIVELLHRTMAVEWREEHEDALLHENLLCLKALCTTALALQYLHSIHATLFPALLHMIFDPEKKGPSEFTTRNIITSVLLTYIECAAPRERLSRTKAVLGYLRDPEAKEEERPVSFVLDMRRDRPYRVWAKETVSVTKEVFWIFLHNLNIVALPPSSSSNPTSPADQTSAATADRAMGRTTGTSRPNTGSHGGHDDQFAYMARHFPQERPPVPAAPYVGGVEWDATNYLASHLDLMNAIIACTGPTAQHRNALRAELRISGWERCMGGSLRLCKEKFYGSVHDGLRTWVAAAAEDGWDVRDVRYGPPPESRSSSPVKKTGGGKKVEEAPRIEIPKLDFGIGGGNPSAAARSNGPWLG